MSRIQIKRGDDTIVHPEWEPNPGGMQICEGCVFGQDRSCRSPQLKANGGAGIAVKYPGHTVTTFRDGWVYEYHGPPKSCTGRRVVALVKSASEAPRTP